MNQPIRRFIRRRVPLATRQRVRIAAKDVLKAAVAVSAMAVVSFSLAVILNGLGELAFSLGFPNPRDRHPSAAGLLVLLVGLLVAITLLMAASKWRKSIERRRPTNSTND